LDPKTKKSCGLILSAGGSRGAYQAGVLKALVEILGKDNPGNPFPILTGVSAGAINASFLSAYADNLPKAIEILTEVWGNVTSEQVFRTDLGSLSKIGFRWLTDVSLGGLRKRAKAKALLDTTPLHDLLKKNIPFDKIEKNLKAGHLDAVGITATDYTTSQCITFVQTEKNIEMWERSRRKSEKTTLQIDHIMASSAIPVLFPPTSIGERFFGDGSLRNMAPLSPAIRLGAEKLIIVGVRSQKWYKRIGEHQNFRPTLARILGIMISSIFFDATDLDVERLSRINRTLNAFPTDEDHDLPLKPIDYLWLQPSEDIGILSRNYFNKLPRIIRYLVSGLGTATDASEIISYLLFEPDFCQYLMKMGYRDCLSRQTEIETFFEK
jgi:NTE family protein